MAEYIKRDNVLKICDWYANEFAEVYIYFKELKMELKALPAEDIHTVKHGRWIEYPECLQYENAFTSDHIVCSRCKAVFNVLDNCTECFVYCPNCGADMRGE